MYLVGLILVPVWLLLALVILVLDGRLWLFAIVAVPTSVIVLIAVALIRDQRKASIAEGVRYQVADDLRRPLVDVVADAEASAHMPTYRLGGGIRTWN